MSKHGCRARWWALLSCSLAVTAGTATEAFAQSVGMALTLGPNQSYSWTAAVDPSSTTAKVLYYILKRDGLRDPLTGGTTIAVVFDVTTIDFAAKHTNTSCYVVKASDTVSGVFSISNTACHCYMHAPGNSHICSVERADGNGTQLGYNNLWKFGYYLDNDAFVTMKVYESSVSFAADSLGLSDLVSQATAPVKVVLSSAPRSTEMVDGSVRNEDFWDSRNSSGTLVKNGIYKLHWIVQDLNGSIVHKMITTVPVDVLRITRFDTTGIAASGGNATISYNITAAASVRMLIAKPGRRLTVDGNGDVQALNLAGTAIDTTKASVVQIINFNRASGNNTEQWNGTDSDGVAVSSGVYVVGISAKDTFGNEATGPVDDQQAISSQIAVDRQADQMAIDTTAPTVSTVTVGSTIINQGGGTSVAAFSSVKFDLNETAGTGANISVVTLSGPGGAVAGGAVTALGNQVTYSTATMLSSSGTYTVNIVAKDAFGNATANLSYNFNIPAPTPPSVSSVTVGAITVNQAGNTSVSAFTSIGFTLSATAGTGALLSTVTVLYGALNLSGTVAAAGTVVTWSSATTISSTGTYTATIVPRDSAGTAGAPVTVTFTIPSGGGGGGGGATMTADAFRDSVKPSPNPARAGPMAVMFTVAAPASVDFDFYTLSGQRIFHQTQSYAAGANNFNWNLSNDSGGKVASGVYLLRITANDGSNVLRTTKKVMILR